MEWMGWWRCSVCMIVLNETKLGRRGELNCCYCYVDLYAFVLLPLIPVHAYLPYYFVFRVE